MAVPPEFIEDLRQRVPLSDLIGKRVKLVRKGGVTAACARSIPRKHRHSRWSTIRASITVSAVARMAMPFPFSAKPMGWTSWRLSNGLPRWRG